MRSIQVTGLLCSFFLLSGCPVGGGSTSGDSESSGAAGTPVEDEGTYLEKAPITLSEGQHRDVEFRLGQEVTFLSLDPFITSEHLQAEIREGKLSVQAGDIKKPMRTTITLQSFGEQLGEIEVFLENTGGQGLVDEAKAWISHEQSVLALREDQKSYETILTLSLLDGEISIEQYRQKMSQWDPIALYEEGAWSARVEAEFEATSEALDNYQDYETASFYDEGYLESQLEDLREEVARFWEYGVAPLHEVKELGVAFSDASRAPSYSAEIGDITTRVGNPELGQMTDIGWVFNEQFAHLETVVQMQTLAQCQVEASHEI